MKWSKSIALVFLVGFCLALLPYSGRAEQNIGIGGKLIGEVPFLIVTFDSNQIGAEVGGGLISSSTDYGSNVSLTYYLANGKYIFPLAGQLRPYAGGGIVGFNVSATEASETASGNASGFDLFAGMEFKLNDYGIPITLFGGANYLGFGDMTFSYDGQSIDYPLNISNTSFHLGLKFVF